MKIIKSIEEFKLDCKNVQQEYFIYLNGGLRSSKNIYYDSAKQYFRICNDIDGTEQRLTEEELYTKSNIGEAIDKKAFYRYSK